MQKPIPYNEEHFRVGTRVCSKETGSIGIVQADFGDYEHSISTHGDLSELVPIKWEGKEKISPVYAVYLTDVFTQEFSDGLKASCDSPDWY